MLDYSVAMLGNPQHEDDPKKAYAFLQTRGTLTIDEIADHLVAHGCNYDRADIIAILTKLVSCSKELLLDGYRINLGDMGLLHLACKSKGAVSLREFTRENIISINVKFKPSKQFENLLGGVSLHKVPSKKIVAAALEAQLNGETSADWSDVEDGDDSDGGEAPEP